MNNLEIVSTTSDFYTDSFGFTEAEVFAAADEYNLPDKEKIKKWYDGFIFGTHCGIYNPWAISNYLRQKKFQPYWVNSSSNSLVGKLLGQSDEYIKEQIQNLLQGEPISTTFDEEIVNPTIIK